MQISRDARASVNSVNFKDKTCECMPFFADLALCTFYTRAAEYEAIFFEVLNGNFSTRSVRKSRRSVSFLFKLDSIYIFSRNRRLIIT